MKENLTIDVPKRQSVQIWLQEKTTINNLLSLHNAIFNSMSPQPVSRTSSSSYWASSSLNFVPEEPNNRPAEKQHSTSKHEATATTSKNEFNRKESVAFRNNWPAEKKHSNSKYEEVYTTSNNEANTQ
ncbi:hypothetical protein O181_042691 [Austropuccinia psidii MF-1]|uniref:Uncharacterized protein n=1 Tax=Austropuccinia psidii MF-1 TaxID=1389203 RepID=A0A9Q3HFC6_9BASI|nr:hypothetical protein [Austropuccinia psidii MF-1]